MEFRAFFKGEFQADKVFVYIEFKLVEGDVPQGIIIRSLGHVNVDAIHSWKVSENDHRDRFHMPCNWCGKICRD